MTRLLQHALTLTLFQSTVENKTFLYISVCEVSRFEADTLIIPLGRLSDEPMKFPVRCINSSSSSNSSSAQQEKWHHEHVTAPEILTDDMITDHIYIHRSEGLITFFLGCFDSHVRPTRCSSHRFLKPITQVSVSIPSWFILIFLYDLLFL